MQEKQSLAAINVSGQSEQSETALEQLRKVFDLFGYKCLRTLLRYAHKEPKKTVCLQTGLLGDFEENKIITTEITKGNYSWRGVGDYNWMSMVLAAINLSEQKDMKKTKGPLLNSNLFNSKENIFVGILQCIESDSKLIEEIYEYLLGEEEDFSKVTKSWEAWINGEIGKWKIRGGGSQRMSTHDELVRCLKENKLFEEMDKAGVMMTMTCQEVESIQSRLKEGTLSSDLKRKIKRECVKYALLAPKCEKSIMRLDNDGRLSLNLLFSQDVLNVLVQKIAECRGLNIFWINMQNNEKSSEEDSGALRNVSEPEKIWFAEWDDIKEGDKWVRKKTTEKEAGQYGLLPERDTVVIVESAASFGDSARIRYDMVLIKADKDNMSA